MVFSSFRRPPKAPPPSPADDRGDAAGEREADRRAQATETRRSTERRGAARYRTRMRPAKLYGEDGRFLADCLIENRSEGGARLAFFGEAPQRGEAMLFDETLGTLVAVALVWSARGMAGVRFGGRHMRLGPLARDRLGGRYYAVGD